MRRTNLFLLAVAILTTACASAPKAKTQTNGVYTTSAYHDGNNPPEKVRPPTDVGGEARPIDNLYLKTEADYHFTLAETYSFEGQTDRALEEFKLTLVYDPKSAHVRMRLGAEYIKKGLISEALEQLESAVQYDPDYTDARLLLGGLYATLRMYEKAEQQYLELMTRQPELSEPKLQLAVLYQEEKKYDQAIEILKKMAADPKNDVPHVAWYYMGRINFERRFFKEAEADYKKSLSLKPDFEEGVLALGKTYEEQSQKDRAFKLYETFQDKSGPSVKVADVLGRMYLDGEEYDKAFRQFEIIEEADPSNLNVKVKMALILIERKDYSRATMKLKQILVQAPDAEKIRFYLGAVYEELKDYDSAIDQFQKIPVVSQYFGESVIHIAYLFKLKGQMDKAMSTIEAGIKQKPEFEQFYSLYASLLYDVRSYDKAIVMLEDATRQFQNNEQLLFFLGSMYDKVGKRRETIRVMKVVIDINPQHGQALNYLAYTFAELNEELDEAETLARRAIALRPEDAFIQDTLGWVLYKRGNYSEAVRALERAYHMKSDESIIAEHLGDAYYHFELPDKAKQMYHRAAELETDGESAKKIRQKITAIEDKHGPSFERSPASVENSP